MIFVFTCFLEFIESYPPNFRMWRQVSEALLDLTGLPTTQVDFADAFTSPEKLWARLVAYADRGSLETCAAN